MFIESIALNEDGSMPLLSFHQARFDKTRRHFFSQEPGLLLSDCVDPTQAKGAGLFKCRVVYGSEIIRIEYLPYQTQACRNLKVVCADSLDYAFKYEERSALERLKAKAEEYDDVLLLKNQLVSDTSYANLVFWDGHEWLTPEKPLLPGVQRAFLLEKRLIRKVDIRLEDLQYFEKVALINAFNPLNPDKAFSCKHIILP